MRMLLSPWTLAIAGILASLALLTSPNAALWAACLLALPVMVGLVGGKQSYRVLIWIVAVNWLQVVGDVVTAELNGDIISEGWLGQYRVRAILFSLCAITALALGMRLGTIVGGSAFRPTVRSGADTLAAGERPISLQRILICYFATFVVAQMLGILARSAPVVAQPLLALNLMKFVCVYLIASKVFTSDRGYPWLMLVSALELVTGVFGFFSVYKEAFMVMLIALASVRRPLRAREWIFGIGVAIAVIWVSLAWSAIKMEYRAQVILRPLEQKIEWVVQRYLVDPIDYRDALTRLVSRIGYTELYAQVLSRQDTGSLPSGLNLYGSAIQHVLTPRILFPDKPILDDSKLTKRLLKFDIGEDTSIGVGYVAEAQVDFGFPGLLVPILLIGATIGLAAKYFMTRLAPLVVIEAFATATLFRTFQFETNIDKALGGFLVGCIAMGLVLRFVYPLIARWLANSRRNRRNNRSNSIEPLRSR